MTTKINDSKMTSVQTRHTAQVAADGGWTVSWLPGRTLTQGQAVTAMTIAKVIGVHADDLTDSGSLWWPHIDGWAAELGITGPHAVAEASLSPEDHAAMRAVVTLALDGQPGRKGYLLALDKSTGTATVRIDGETLTMPAVHLQYADAGPAQDDGDDEDAPDRSALIDVMTADERAWLLSFIADYAPGVFVAALADLSETFADELAERIGARDEAEYLAEDEGYCTVCGANVSWFMGYEGPQHFRGLHKLVTGTERRELFDAGHAPAIAWRESTVGSLGLRDSEDQNGEAGAIAIVRAGLTYAAGGEQ